MTMTRGTAAVAALVCVSVGWIARDQSKALFAQSRSPLVVTHIFTGPDGQSHAEQIEMAMSPAAPPTAGSIDASAVVGVRELRVLRTSPDYLSDFSPGRNRQYVVMVSGRREIEVADGKKVQLGPGTVLLVEDVTGKGHLTRGVGSEDAVSIIVPLADQK